MKMGLPMDWMLRVRACKESNATAQSGAWPIVWCHFLRSIILGGKELKRRNPKSDLGHVKFQMLIIHITGNTE